MSLELWQWALAFACAFLIGVSKTGINGLGMFAIVAFAIILPARESVGVVLPVLLAGDVVAITMYRRDVNWGHLLRIFPWAGLGVAIGAFAAGQLPDALMRVIIGLIVIGLAILQIVRGRRSPDEAAVPPPAWLSPAAGLLAGATTMIANAGGPLMTIYLLAMKLPVLVFVGTGAWFFLAVNLFKVPFSLSLGLITPATLGLSLRLAPFAILGALSGRRLVSDMNQRLFDTIALGLTLIAGVRLLVG